MKDVHIIVALCADQILPAVNYAFRKKINLSRFARALCAAPTHIQCQYRTSQIFSKTVTTQYQSVENAGVALVKGADERNKFFEKIYNL